MVSRVSIIGAGRVGTAIALCLRAAGYDVVGVASRSLTGAAKLAHKVGCSRFSEDPCEVVDDSEIVFIMTPDHEIVRVCEKIAPYISRGTLVIHTSGALSSKILNSAKIRGALCLSMHPCQSFSDISTAPERLTGCYFCLEGDEEAVRKGQALARAMNCRSFVLGSSQKILYHIACSVASNYLVVLVERVLSILEKTEVSKDKAIKMIIPLLEGTLKNIEDLGVKGALTGPIERGEIQTLKEEIEIIKKRIPEFADLYKILGREAIRIAVQKGELSPEIENKLFKILE